MLEVYHGSTMTIDYPLVSVGREHLDFGKGFYVTTLKSQAISWAERQGDRIGARPVLNTYSFDDDIVRKEYRYLQFHAYDITWLDFIAANRNGKELWRTYDVIEGGIANDRVTDTVEAYIAGLMSAGIALKNLSMHKPNNQICILRQEIVDKYLDFIKSENI